MVIGDDDVDAEFARASHHFLSANAGVDADDQAHAHGRGALDHFRAHAVAFADAMRHMVRGLAAGQLDGFFQDHHRHGTVHVVVAVDQDFFLGFDGGSQALDGFAHSGERQGIVQVIERRRQESLRGLRIGEAAVHQHTRGERLGVQRGGQVRNARADPLPGSAIALRAA